MKKIIFIYALIILGFAHISYSTPVHDYGTEADRILIPNDNIFTFNEYTSVSFENIFPASQVEINDNNTFLFSNQWIPSWNNRPDWRNFSKLFDNNYYCPKSRPGSAPSPVPEPATILLFGSGLVGLAYIRRKGKNKDA